MHLRAVATEFVLDLGPVPVDVKKIKSFKSIHLIHFLCDALKPLTLLALTFESNEVDLSVDQPRLQLTLSTLQQLKERPALNTREVRKLLQSLDVSPSDQQVNAIQLSKSTFLANLVANIRCRFEGSDIVSALNVFCNTSETSALCGSEDLDLLAEHYS